MEFRAIAAAAAAAGLLALSPARADTTIYSGGPILTMNDAQPKAEAIAVRDGRILAVGTRAAVEAKAGADAKTVDLGGKTLMPAFLDAHSHFINALAIMNQANVSAPPVGPAKDVAGILAELKKFKTDRKIPDGELIIGYGYDENNMPNGEVLTRDAIDSVLPNNPAMVIHVSLHGAVLNSAAMKKYGISAQTKTPPGGIIARKPGSNEPAGLVMETAWIPIFAKLPQPTKEDSLKAIKFAQNLYASYGIATAHEGASHLEQIELLQHAASKGALYIDVIAYAFISDLENILKKNPPSTFGKYKNGLKLGGCKATQDGSVQGRTAYFSRPYLTGGPVGQKNWRGEPEFPQDVLNKFMKTCYDAGLQTLVHANGDAAIDMVLEGHRYAAGKDLSKDRRTIVVHAQFATPAQLDKMVEYKLIPSFYSEHTFFFSAAHLKNLGKEMTFGLSPMRTAIDKGLKPTNHTDFNVVPINQMWTVWTAVTRASRTGEVIGPKERVTPTEALKAITIHAARQYSEEGRKGSLEPGKQADLIILSADPTTIDPMKIKDIVVLETIKDGKTVYKR